MRRHCYIEILAYTSGSSMCFNADIYRSDDSWVSKKFLWFKKYEIRTPRDHPWGITLYPINDAITKLQTWKPK